MESPSPVPSTPISGLSLQGKWSFKLTPEESVRKKLFELDAAATADDGELHQWSSSSEYFSQSANDPSCLSDESQYPSGQEQGMSASLFFTTPNPSPTKRCQVSLCDTPPPLLKRQRLFSPSSPATPDKFPVDFQSPVRPSPRPSLDSSCDSVTAMNIMGAHQNGSSTDGNGGSSDVMITSPPRLERLQLLDYPCTPLSIVRTSGLQVPDQSEESLRKTSGGKAFSRIKRRIARSGPELVRHQSRGTNINPFTPSECSPNARGVKSSAPLPSTDPKPRKRLALKESNISRYREEFHEVCQVGSGSFGTVYKCINRLDGCVYALKRSHKPVAGSPDEAAALREVCAHAVLGSHQHLVRYYSAWAENNHMLIQNEFCDGGNLSAKILANQYQGGVFNENELKTLLGHISLGLQYIHSMGLVHMDIKPENIFISSHHDAPLDTESKVSAVYKIGDMGHVTAVSEPRVEEGDCRYLAREILQENYSQLPKGDVFSLGLTVFQAGSGLDLPKNGEFWHKIRDGGLPHLSEISLTFNKLLQMMVHPIPEKRPTAMELLAIMCPSAQKSKAQLCKELNEEKFKNEVLQRELAMARGNDLESTTASDGKRLLNGTRLNRSMSIT